MPQCIVPGCGSDAVNNLGVRLRHPPQSDALWSPNANAFLCDEHARSGARITLIYEATTSGRVETVVYASVSPITRRTTITTH